MLLLRETQIVLLEAAEACAPPKAQSNLVALMEEVVRSRKELEGVPTVASNAWQLTDVACAGDLAY